MTTLMNKRADLLISIARKQTTNEEFSSNTGIEDDVLLQYLNEGQERIYNLITAKHQTVFVEEAPLVSVVAGQEAYDLPSDTHLGNRVTSVEYASTGLIRDLQRLRPASLLSRETAYEGYPSEYIRRSGKILLQPVPSLSGILRINYQKHVSELDFRRGKVSAVTLDSATKTITSLTLDTTEENYDDTNIALADHICVVNTLGIQQMTKIQIDSIDATTGIITVNSNFTYSSGETISVGDYITLGYMSTTHSELPKTCERYLVQFLSWKILKQDSSEDAADVIIELSSMERNIIDGFANVSDDITLIPMTNIEDV